MKALNRILILNLLSLSVSRTYIVLGHMAHKVSNTANKYILKRHFLLKDLAEMSSDPWATLT